MRLPEITVCPPLGTNTALNLDLVAIEEVELSKEERDDLTKVAVENLHNNSISKFAEEQALFHTSESIFDLYSGSQQMFYAFTLPEYSGVSSGTYPETFKHGTVMSPVGAFQGSFSSLGWGQLVTKDNLHPSLELNYTAYISSKVFKTSKPRLVIHIESRMEETPVPYRNVPSSDASESIRGTLGKQLVHFSRNEDYENFTEKFELDAKDIKEPFFTVEFSRLGVQKKLGTLQSGFSVSWHIEDNNGTQVLPKNANEENTVSLTLNPDRFDGEDSSEEDHFQPVTRWFNILNDFYSVRGMELKSIWELVRKVKVTWLYRENSVSCDLYTDPQTGTKFFKENLENDDIEELLRELNESDAINDNATLSKNALPSAVWEEGFRMFSFIAYCPSIQLKDWTQFYIDTLAHSPPRAILQKIAEIFNRKIMIREDTRTESAVYMAMSKIVPFKAGNATFALSSDKELLKNINSPLLRTLKGSLVGWREPLISSFTFR